jgi:hypothetical protein
VTVDERRAVDTLEQMISSSDATADEVLAMLAYRCHGDSEAITREAEHSEIRRTGRYCGQLRTLLQEEIGNDGEI